jgi:hypothetical protein
MICVLTAYVLTFVGSSKINIYTQKHNENNTEIGTYITIRLYKIYWYNIILTNTYTMIQNRSE